MLSSLCPRFFFSVCLTTAPAGAKRKTSAMKNRIELGMHDAVGDARCMAWSGLRRAQRKMHGMERGVRDTLRREKREKRAAKMPCAVFVSELPSPIADVLVVVFLPFLVRSCIQGICLCVWKGKSEKARTVVCLLYMVSRISWHEQSLDILAAEYQRRLSGEPKCKG